MKIDSKKMVSISEANQNFSKVARLVDQMGSVTILKNNQPSYVLIKFDEESEEFLEKTKLLELSERYIKKNDKAYKKLAEWKKMKRLYLIGLKTINYKNKTLSFIKNSSKKKTCNYFFWENSIIIFLLNSNYKLFISYNSYFPKEISPFHSTWINFPFLLVFLFPLKILYNLYQVDNNWLWHSLLLPKFH